LENYIVRIYRRDHDESIKVVGIVESVETEKKQAFKNMDELTRILCNPKRKSSPKKKKPTQDIKSK
jgi:hypothetical protein